jgi:5-methylcytosine-specific restriction endonuclease McrA
MGDPVSGQKELMQHVFVVDTNKKPCNPVDPGKARVLLSRGKAAVLRRFPFTIVLKEDSCELVQPIRIKLDPGSRQTGVALVDETTCQVVFAMEIIHRGLAISKGLLSRKGVRRGRRARNTRYRKPGLPNTTNPEGWLAPSLKHRVLTVETWVNRIRRFAPVAAISMELVRFDMQQMENPEISGIEYQQGTLLGYEVREYLLNKWHRKCCYCEAENVPLQIEHIEAKTNGGSNRISNLGLACEPCNTKKGKLDIRQFLKNKPELLSKILKQAKASLKDAAAVNSTRWALYENLKATGLPVETGSGGRTKFNRVTRSYPKAHWIDAACVGATGADVAISEKLIPLIAKTTGHGCRQVTRTDRFGFPRQTAKKGGSVFGFQTGDMVRAIVPAGKKIGTYAGRVAVRATGSFDIQTKAGLIAGINHKYCELTHAKDGYAYL